MGQRGAAGAGGRTGEQSTTGGQVLFLPTLYYIFKYMYTLVYTGAYFAVYMWPYICVLRSCSVQHMRNHMSQIYICMHACMFT
jgi:hypothetical protein